MHPSRENTLRNSNMSSQNYVKEKSNGIFVGKTVDLMEKRRSSYEFFENQSRNLANNSEMQQANSIS